MDLTSPATLYVDHQFTSPYAMSVYVALLEKQLPFNLVTIDLEAGEQHGLDYGRKSLTQRVPTLVMGDFALSESTAITEYLHELHPEGVSLYPQDVQSRAKARQVQAWLRSDLLPIRMERSTQVIFYAPVDTPLSANAQHAVKKLFEVAQALLAHGGDHLFGAWSVADVDLALMLNRLLLNGDPVPERLAQYAHQQWALPSIQAWVKQVRPPL